MHYQHFAIAPGATATWQLRLPPVALLGWIPLDGGDAQNDALQSLVAVGNAPPPECFSGPGGFTEHVERKDFRAALALDDVSIGLDEAGGFASVSFYHLIRCGYTPLPPRNPVFYWGGQGYGRPKVLATREEIRIRVSLWFKLGKLTSLAARALSGYWPASANAEIELCLTRRPLSAAISFYSSCVPSMRHYLDWKSYGEDYDMLTAPAEFNEFLNLGYCNDATSYERCCIILPDDHLRPERLFS